MSWSQEVYSQMISRVGWNSDTEELEVTFKKGGKTAAYQGVTEAKAEQLANAPSVGSMFLNEIRDQYQFRYI